MVRWIEEVEEEKEEKEEKEYALSTFCCVNPNSSFYPSITNPSFKRMAREPFSFILLFSCMFIEEEFMEDLRPTKTEVRKLKILSLYFCYLQLKGEASLDFSHLTKKDYEEFKSHSHH